MDGGSRRAGQDGGGGEWGWGDGGSEVGRRWADGVTLCSCPRLRFKLSTAAFLAVSMELTRICLFVSEQHR